MRRLIHARVLHVLVLVAGLVALAWALLAPVDQIRCHDQVMRPGDVCSYSSLTGEDRKVIEIPTCDQYGVAGDAFAESIMRSEDQPVPLEDSLMNMRVLDAAFRAAANGAWERP